MGVGEPDTLCMALDPETGGAARREPERTTRPLVSIGAHRLSGFCCARSPGPFPDVTAAATPRSLSSASQPPLSQLQWERGSLSQGHAAAGDQTSGTTKSKPRVLSLTARFFISTCGFQGNSPQNSSPVWDRPGVLRASNTENGNTIPFSKPNGTGFSPSGCTESTNSRFQKHDEWNTMCQLGGGALLKDMRLSTHSLRAPPDQVSREVLVD